MPVQVNGRIARQRAEEIRSVIRRKRGDFLRAQAGRTLSALVLDDVHDGARVALSTNYLKIGLADFDAAPNTLLDVRVGGVAGDALFGYPETRLAGRAQEA